MLFVINLTMLRHLVRYTNSLASWLIWITRLNILFLREIRTTAWLMLVLLLPWDWLRWYRWR